MLGVTALKISKTLHRLVHITGILLLCKPYASIHTFAIQLPIILFVHSYPLLNPNPHQHESLLFRVMLRVSEEKRHEKFCVLFLLYS